jgi:hypothetical protein
MPTAYKVLNNINGKRYSFASLPRGFRFNYSLKGVNRAKRGRFFIFKTREDAEEFVRCEGTVSAMEEIWQVEVDKILPAPKLLVSPCDSTIAEFQAFWDGRRKQLEDNMRETPVGSRTCNTIKLIKKLS